MAGGRLGRRASRGVTEVEKELFSTLERGGVCLTATRRLAREVGRAYDRWQRSRGREAWAAAACLPLTVWLREQWAATWPATHLPGEPLHLAAWEGVIGDDLGAASRSPLEVASLAPVAAAAARLVAHYRLGESAATEEERALFRWRRAFSRRCRDLGWLDPATLADAVAGAIEAGEVAVPGEVLLAGFDRLSPAEEAVVAALRARGSAVRRWAPHPAQPPAWQRTGCADNEAELRAAAHWCRHRWRPGVRLGVVVPDLATWRPLAEEIFTAELDPASILPGSPEAAAFDISLGPPLAHQPVVAAALAALRAVNGELTQDGAAALLADPFVGGAEREGRARAEAALRRAGRPHLRLHRLAAAARAAGAVETARCLDGLDRALSPPQRLAPSGWATRIIEALAAAGWPGPRTATSREVQAVRAFHQQVAALASLDPVVGRLSRAAAVGRLGRLCGHPFQPQGGAAPVQLLGLLEAAGIPFDAVWVAGLDAATLPRPPRPHPLLSVALQRRFHLPHATAEGELARARRLLADLQAATPDGVVSYPRQEGEARCVASPLIADFPEMAPHPPHSASLVAAVAAAAPSLEVVAERSPPPVAPGPVRGGSRLVEAQSLCPFRAFATHRLGAEPLEAEEEAPGPRARGTLVHAALEEAWGDLSGHADLIVLDEGGRRDLCETAAEAAVAGSKIALDPPQEAVVRSWLADLVGEWLAVEAARPPFTVVAAERPAKVVVGGLTLGLRIDRIDRIDDGRLLLLDYKTGRVAPGDWWGDRPLSPQLPLYTCIDLAAVVGDDQAPLAGVAYGVVRPGECSFKGVGEGTGIPGLLEADDRRVAASGAKNWSELRAGWGAVVERLGAAFAAGEAAVAPLLDSAGRPRPCDRCHLAPLCRIHDREAV